MIVIFIGIFVICGTVLALVWAIWRPAWLGFEDKTLWDWIAILSFPTVIGLATVLIATMQMQIERDRTSENALQLYFGRISELALDERLAGREDTIAAIGRAETLALLHLVEGERAGRAFAFLSEMSLLQTFQVSFEGFDLAGAELKGLDLVGMDFEASELSAADLEGTRLRGVDFEHAILVNTDFKKTDLRNADFEDANVSGAEFRGADMRGTDLRLARGLVEKQLARSCMDATTLLPVGFAPITAPTEACQAVSGN